MVKKCIFLDRDGVINKDYVDYVYSAEKLEILSGVVETIRAFKEAGYLIIVITNQSGISKGVYSREQMHETHRLIQEACGHCIEHFYYAPGHPTFSETLSRKPDSLLFEKAIAKFKVDAARSWMIGDKDKDLLPAKKLGIRTIQVDNQDSTTANFKVKNLAATRNIILGA